LRRHWSEPNGERAGTAPPGSVYAFAPDWKEEQVHRHLAKTRSIMQADGCKGYAKLYDPDPDGSPRLREAACWAHLRRDFHDEWDKTKSAITRVALDRTSALHDIEREITGRPADIRLAARQKYSSPKVAAGPVAVWCRSFDSVMYSKGDDSWAQEEQTNFVRTRFELH
jgi:transposase